MDGYENMTKELSPGSVVAKNNISTQFFPFLPLLGPSHLPVVTPLLQNRSMGKCKNQPYYTRIEEVKGEKGWHNGSSEDIHILYFLRSGEYVRIQGKGYLRLQKELRLLVS